MKKRESKLWQRIKKNITKPHFIRVESNTINGIPDINGCWETRIQTRVSVNEDHG